MKNENDLGIATTPFDLESINEWALHGVVASLPMRRLRTQKRVRTLDKICLSIVLDDCNIAYLEEEERDEHEDSNEFVVTS